MIGEYDMDSILGLVPLTHANKIHFGVKKDPGWFTFTFQDSIFHDLRAFEVPLRSDFTNLAVYLRSRDE